MSQMIDIRFEHKELSVFLQDSRSVNQEPNNVTFWLVT